MHSLAQMEAYVTRQIKKLIELKRYWKKPHLIARYFNSLRQFRAMGGIVSHYCPIVTEFKDNAGVAGGQYFHQDLLVAHFVANKNPRRHIDVGSRIDGFVAHIASFRSIEVLDIRDLPDTGHENIRFLRADLMQEVQIAITDSISCLHAIEHFGLGRYGDDVDPNGHRLGFANLVKMLEPGGMLYISFPISFSNQVHFNAHRFFHPTDILTWYQDGEMELLRFDYVDDRGSLHKNIDVHASFRVRNGCGIYSLRKTG